MKRRYSGNPQEKRITGKCLRYASVGARIEHTHLVGPTQGQVTRPRTYTAVSRCYSSPGRRWFCAGWHWNPATSQFENLSSPVYPGRGTGGLVTITCNTTFWPFTTVSARTRDTPTVNSASALIDTAINQTKSLITGIEERKRAQYDAEREWFSLMRAEQRQGSTWPLRASPKNWRDRALARTRHPPSPHHGHATPICSTVNPRYFFPYFNPLQSRPSIHLPLPPLLARLHNRGSAENSKTRVNYNDLDERLASIQPSSLSFSLSTCFHVRSLLSRVDARFAI